jgi:hypothetical protein
MLIYMKIRRATPVIVLAIFGFFGVITVKADATQMSQINYLLMQVESKIPENYRYPEAIVEGGNWKRSAEFAQLQSAVQANWSTLASNLKAVAPSETDQTILFAAFQSIPADKYLQFLDKAVALAQSNVISKRLLKWALLPADKNVRGVLDYNYQKPVVKDILQRVKVLYADDPNMIGFCNDVLSGQSKKDDEAYFNDNPADPRPNPAVENPGQGTGQQ